MKVRNGFVSNSSSCSFVVIGFVTDKKIDKQKILKTFFDDEYQKIISNAKNENWNEDEFNEAIYNVLYDQDKIYFCDDIECGSPHRNSILIGHLIAEGDDDCDILESKQIDLNTALNELKILQNNLNLHDEEIKIITGTKMC